MLHLVKELDQSGWTTFNVLERRADWLTVPLTPLESTTVYMQRMLVLGVDQYVRNLINQSLVETEKITLILNPQVHKETFDLLVGQYPQREEWNFVTITFGELFVMIFGG